MKRLAHLGNGCRCLLHICSTIGLLQWNPAKTFYWTCNCCISLIQKFDVNWVSRSETIVSGSAYPWPISFTNIKATSLMCASVFQGSKFPIFENLSTMTHILVYPSDLGNTTMKCLHMKVNDLIGTLLFSNREYFLCWMNLLCWHICNDPTYSITCSTMFGQ